MTSQQREKYTLFDLACLVKNRLVPITPAHQRKPMSREAGVTHPGDRSCARQRQRVISEKANRKKARPRPEAHTWLPAPSCTRLQVAADGQLAGTPSVLFDAVAVILSDKGAKALSMEGAAIDFVRDAYAHLKAIAVDQGGQALLKEANVGHDAGVVDVNDKNAFIAAAKTRLWDREKSVRTLA
jgi:hypothetical protein